MLMRRGSWEWGGRRLGWCWIGQVLRAQLDHNKVQRKVEVLSRLHCHAFLPRISEMYCCCLVAKLRQTLWDPTDWIPPGSSLHGTSQARILEWVVISFSRGSSQSRDRTHLLSILHWQVDSLSLSHLINQELGSKVFNQVSQKLIST